MSAEPVFVPLRASEFHATETYRYRQEISGNPRMDAAEPPTGSLRLVFPLDGAQGASRAAAERVGWQLAQPGHSGRLLVGYLGLADEGRSDLHGALGGLSDYGILPLTVDRSELPDNPVTALTADRHRLEFTQDYAPKQPRLQPVRLVAGLFDEEHFSGEGQRLVTRDGFLRCLTLQLQVEVVVPQDTVDGEAQPVLEELLVPWPGIPSLRNFQFVVAGEFRERPVRFDPDRRSLVIRDLPVTPRNPEGEQAVYASPPLLLMINQPAELSQQADLTVECRVRFPGCLLSGARLRHFNAAGQGSGHLGQPTAECRLHLRSRLQLGDLFRSRPRRPWLAIRFERVIPDRERLTNIQDALVDLGFRTPSTAVGGDPSSPPWRFEVERREGPHQLRLAVEVGGARRRIQVEEEQGLRMVRSERETGDLEVVIMADFRGDDVTAGNYLNQLHEELRKRFRSAITEG